MIALDIKQQNPIEATPLSLSPKDVKPLASFASLLNAAQEPKVDAKALSKGLLLISDKEKTNSFSKDSKGAKNSILTLIKMKKSEEPKGLDDFVEMNPKLTISMSVNEVKTLILKAKSYIKSQIAQSKGFKKQELASLPKTLKGLVEVAKKIGIDISKITVEKVQEMPQTRALKGSKVANNVVLRRTNTSAMQNTKEKNIFQQSRPLFTVETKKEVTNPKNQNLKTVISQTISKVDKDLKRSDTKVVKTEDIAVKKEHTTTPTQSTKEKNTLQQETPLFKEHTKREITTQEFVAMKSLQNSEIIPKKIKSAQNLEILLQEKKISHKNNIDTNLTANFSLATGKVVSPKIDEKGIKTLETLLSDNDTKTEKSDVQHKTEMVHTLKAESLEVKLHEAKQMVKYLSHDVKNAIEEYKSPFTRLKVELHPQKLGKIELTIVERGKKLHINLSSNNTALNTLAMNVNDLKLQLNNNGINNATFNFNSNTQSDSFQSGQQQQQQQQKEQARNEYSYTQTQERGEEILSSLEIIVPHYA